MQLILDIINISEKQFLTIQKIEERVYSFY